jgi:cell division protein ZapD
VVILYEYPLNERIRTLLRLEDLFSRFDHFAASQGALEHHVALTTLFEVLEVTSRADLKSDLLQELERQRQSLSAFRDNPEVSRDVLDRVLDDIDATSQRLTAATGKTGQHLRDNEWLMSIRNRAAVAGGTCEFDLPSYHAWLHRDPVRRLGEIHAWEAPFRPLRDGLGIVLRLLRDSAHRTVVRAHEGAYQQMLGGRVVHMLQVRIDDELGAIPEISASKHMIRIRFTHQGGDLRPRPFEGLVSFEMALCSL